MNFHDKSSRSFHTHHPAPSYKRRFICTYYMRDGHISTHCRVKDNFHYYDLMWLPKGIKNTNMKGLKIWVPKSTLDSHLDTLPSKT